MFCVKMMKYVIFRKKNHDFVTKLTNLFLTIYFIVYISVTSDICVGWPSYFIFLYFVATK